MKKLSKSARIIIAIISLSLIGTYYVPVWRIDLFAPQYPEGLTMQIWLTKLSGDIDIINGLNHYIGMKKISVEMFPEFTYLVYIVAFYILLGLTTAITGNRKFLFAYLVCSAIGGVLALYDFYQWGYDYGHNLNPDAPIKVPGLAYQPPVLGHKRLLNFDAYSTPDIGGWIVVIAGVIAFLIWFFSWYKERKAAKKMAAAALMMLSVALFQSCNTTPQPIDLGRDVCHTCKMGFVDPKFGGEVISNKGKVFKFDDVICMVQFIKSGTLSENEIKQMVLVNYEKANDFIETGKAFLVVSPAIKTPMNSNAAAFSTKEAATNFNTTVNGQLLTWNEVYSKIQ